MSNHKDLLIKKAFEELSLQMPEPDVGEAWTRMNKKYAKKIRRKQVLTAIAIIFVFTFIAAAPGPTQAVRNFVFFTFNRITGETLMLIQKGNLPENNQAVSVNEPGIYFYNKLEQMQKEKATGLFVPGDEHSDTFISAKVEKFRDRVTRMVIEFHFNDTPVFLEQVPIYGEGGVGQGIDTDDASTETVVVNGLTINILYHKTGLVSLDWRNNNINYSLYGMVADTTLISYGQKLQLF